MKKSSVKLSVFTVFCFLITALSVTSTLGVTLAKYFSSTDSSAAAVPQPFYFTSDKLSEDTPHHRLKEPGDGENAVFEFSLMNYVDSLRRTSSDIVYSYNVYAVSGETVLSDSGKTLSKNADSKENITLSIPPAAFYDSSGASGNVTVEVISSSPYTKTVSCTLSFTDWESGVQWSVSDSGNEVVLNIFGGSGESVSVAWQDTLTPDSASSVFSGYTGNSVSFTAQSRARYALVFLKTDASLSYSEDSFVISVS